MDKYTNTQPFNNKDVYKTILQNIYICKRYNCPILFTRLYNFLKIYKFDIFTILEQFDTNIFILSVKNNYYDILFNFIQYNKLDLTDIDKKNSLNKNSYDYYNQLYNGHNYNNLILNLKNISSNPKNITPEYVVKSHENLYLYKYFINSLYYLPYNSIVIMYNMYLYYNGSYPNINDVSSLITLIMHNIYRKDSLQFLINYKFITIFNITDINYYNLCIIDLIYDKYKNYLLINHTKLPLILNLLLYIFHLLVLNNYDINQYHGKHKTYFNFVLNNIKYYKILKTNPEYEINTIKNIFKINKIDNNINDNIDYSTMFD